VLLTDFGIAKTDETSAVKLTQTGSFLATFAYAAPEQIEGGAIDHRVDIYALGAVLFELLTGRQPFLGNSPYSLMVAHLQTPPPDPREVRPDLPEGFAAVVAAAMAKDRNQRPPSGRALARAASDVLGLTDTRPSGPYGFIATGAAPVPTQPSAPPDGARPPAESTIVDGTPAEPPRPPSRTPAEPTNIFNLTPAEPVNPVRLTPAGPTNVLRAVIDEPHQRVGFAGPQSFHPGSAPGAGPPPRPDNQYDNQNSVGQRPRGRRPRLIAAALALVLVAVGVTAWYLLTVPDLAAPEGFTATSLVTGVSLTWEEVAGAEEYEVLRADEVLLTTPDTEAVDNSGESGVAYDYRVRALGARGSASPATQSVQAYAPLRAPEGLSASSTGADVALTWTDVPNAIGYEISRDGTVLGQSDVPEFLDTTAPSGELRYTVAGISDNSDIAAAPAVEMLEHAAWGALQSLATAFEGIVANRPGGLSDYGATCTPGGETAGTLHFDAYIVCAYPNGIRLDVLHYPDEAALAAAYAQLLPFSRTETTWNYNNSTVPEGPLLRSTEASPVAWRWVGYYNIADRVLCALYVEWPGHSDQELYDVWWLPTRIG
ncbi:MAG: protein kinase, partial [Actinomycetota bacterium]|nr:protein kinase [Actinomycetota bacterium]